MALLTRTTPDFIPNTLIESQQVDNELNQLVNALSGVSTNKDILLKYSHATDPVLRVDQLGAGVIQQWLQNSVEKARILNDGSLFTPALRDSNGNELLILTATGSAVNELTLVNAATGNGPTLSATGGDSNVGININPKGTGEISLGGPLNVTGASSGSANLIEVFETGDGTARSRLTPDGKFQTRAGNGATPATSFLTLGGLYNVNFTPVGNVGSGEDDLMTKTVESNVLGEDGDSLLIYAWGTSAANTNSKTIRPYYGGALDARTVNFNAVGTWEVFLIVTRNSSTQARYFSRTAWWNSGVATPIVDFGTQGTISVTHSSTNVCKVTGEATSTDDIVQNGFIMLKFSTT